MYMGNAITVQDVAKILFTICNGGNPSAVCTPSHVEHRNPRHASPPLSMTAPAVGSAIAVVPGTVLVLAAAVAVLCSSATGEDVPGTECAAVRRGRPVVPAMYVFGDSLVDDGNNNFLPPPAPKAVPPNGIDLPLTVFPRAGRYTNGYNLADIIGALQPSPGNVSCLLCSGLRRGGDSVLLPEILWPAEWFKQNLLKLAGIKRAGH